MNLQRTTDLIAKHEGLRTWAYKDTRGIWTTGIGFNLQRQGAAAVLAAHSIDFAPIWAACQNDHFVDAHGVTRTRGDVVSVDQARTLAADDIQDSINDLRTFVHGFDAMPDDAQMVLIDLHFNLGGHTLRSWTHTVGHAVAQNWSAMADDLTSNHIWVSEVGSRAADNAAILKAL